MQPLGRAFLGGARLLAPGVRGRGASCALLEQVPFFFFLFEKKMEQVPLQPLVLNKVKVVV